MDRITTTYKKHPLYLHGIGKIHSIEFFEIFWAILSLEIYCSFLGQITGFANIYYTHLFKSIIYISSKNFNLIVIFFIAKMRNNRKRPKKGCYIRAIYLCRLFMNASIYICMYLWIIWWKLTCKERIIAYSQIKMFVDFL